MQAVSARRGAASLIASMLATPIHAAEFGLDHDTKLSIYATVEPKLVARTNASGETEGELTDEDSTLGVAVEHAYGDAVTGFAQAEFEYDADAQDGLGSTDSAFVGLRGPPGKIRAGNFDSIYEDAIIDTTEVAEAAEISDEQFTSENNQIAYYSPSLAGFSMQAQVRYIGKGEATNNTGESGTGLSIVGNYNADRWAVRAGYDDTGAEISGGAGPFDEEGTLGAAATLELAPLELGAKVAIQGNESGDPAGDRTRFTALRATYRYTQGKLYGAAQRVAPEEGDSRSELTGGAEYALYEHLTLWTELGRFDRPNGRGDAFHIGAIYSF